jgi:hypothetical protein
LGAGVGGFGGGAHPPNPQSPIPNPQSPILFYNIIKTIKNLLINLMKIYLKDLAINKCIIFFSFYLLQK